MIKNTCFDDNFQKAKNILLKPLLLKFKVYLFWTAKSGAKAFILPLSPSGGGGLYCKGYGFLTSFGL